jgi:hypothetical protein
LQPCPAENAFFQRNCINYPAFTYAVDQNVLLAQDIGFLAVSGKCRINRFFLKFDIDPVVYLVFSRAGPVPSSSAAINPRDKSNLFMHPPHNKKIFFY